ncbi:uncharacterized protein PRCAT00004585001 [Priceomyces carsonii]|uniref:uncharacterized protein n=1 Tax=Priceomyces carsonii TaxID=28549 RepID=UPI002EDB7861|nr:unnamed protein product [Priceomyces carsonii]
MQLSRIWNGVLASLMFGSDSGDKLTGLGLNEDAGSVNVLQTFNNVVSENEDFGRRRPLVIWHGLGDNYNSSGILRVTEIMNQIYPDLAIYIVKLNPDPSKDQHKTLFGDAKKEVEQVCELIGKRPELDAGFDAIGFSQGGLFMRALTETCKRAKVKNLITFGSPHMGVMDLPLCRDEKDWVCRRRNELLKRQVWNEKIQKTIVPAQYFRDPYQFDNYVLKSHFLAEINNERADEFNPDFGDRLKDIEKFVMVTFTQDTTLVPKGSAAFNDIDVNTGDLIPFDKTVLYEKNLIGLRDLNELKKLEFLSIEEDHMRIPDTFLVDIANEYIGREN